MEFAGFSLDTPAFLETLDVYVVSSLSEGLPLSVLEAMGAALPVVGTAVGEIPEILRKAQSGWLSPPARPDELAAAMAAAAAAPDLEAIGQRNRSTVVKYYSAERMSEDYERLYQQLLARHGKVLDVKT